jgi:hypothetical protein
MQVLISSILAIALVDGPQVEGPAPAPARSLDSYLHADTAPAAPERKGTGLLVTGGILGGLGVIANVTRIGMAQGLCRDISYDYKTATFAGAQSCLNGTGALIALSPTALGLNLAAFGLIAGGASTRGRWRAYETVHEGADRRRAGLQIGIGAGIMTAAIVGYAVTRVMSFADVLGAQTCLGRYPDDPADSAQANGDLARCIHTRWSGYLAGITATQTASLLGVGLLAHGAGYHRGARLYRRALAHQIRLRPNLTATWAGVSLTGRF